MSIINEGVVAEMITRLKELLDAKNDTTLAKKLGVSVSTISTWKSRGSFDINSITNVIDNLSIDWLLFGIGDPYLKNRELDKKEKLANYMNNPYSQTAMLLDETLQYTQVKKEKRVKIPVMNSNVQVGELDYDVIKGYLYIDTIINKNCLIIEMTDDTGVPYGLYKLDKVVVNTSVEPKDGNLILVSFKDQFHICRYKEGLTNAITFVDGKEMPFLADIEYEGVCVNLIRGL